jgi:hypothetical protein
MTYRFAPAALALLACCLSACKQAAPPATPSAVRVTVNATDYAFDLPDTIDAGLVTMTMVNQGKEPHQTALVRIDSGKTMRDIQGAMSAEGAPPAWMAFVGGPNTILPGDSSTAVQVLTSGSYLLLCFLPAPDGTMHLMKGMLKTITVRPAAAPAVEPTADVVLTMKDYGFDLSTPLTAGTRMIRVENAGPQLHEVMLFRLAPGKTLRDFQGWAMAGMKGTPPALPAGGIVGLDQGKHASFPVTLAPGKYILGCFVPDAKDGKPHAMHGMVQTVTVS